SAICCYTGNQARWDREQGRRRMHKKGTIRPLMAEDDLAVATLFQKIFLHRTTAPSPALLSDIRAVYFDDPACHPDLPSHVYVDETGAVCGFIGVHALPMSLAGRPLRMALCSSIMVDGEKAGSLAGAKLLKTTLNGPQDLSFTDTASEVSLRMWRSLGATALAQHSLDWIRVIRPAAAMMDAASGRLPFLKYLKPVAYPVDRLLRRRMAADQSRWIAMTDKQRRIGPTTRTINAHQFAEIFTTCTESFLLRPAFALEDLTTLVRKALPKPSFGEAILSGVFDRNDTAIGAFLYHVRSNSTARVLQIVARQGLEDAVFDALIVDAARRGASLVRGRMQPNFMETILGRRVPLLNVSS